MGSEDYGTATLMTPAPAPPHLELGVLRHPRRPDGNPSLREHGGASPGHQAAGLQRKPGGGRLSNKDMPPHHTPPCS